MVWNAWAAEVERELFLYKRPAFMERPATLPDSDQLAHSRLMSVVMKGSRALQGDRELYEDWLYWKRNVLEAEAIATKRLATVVAAIYWSEQLEEPSLRTRIERLRDFARSQYGIDVPRPCPHDFDRRCESWARDRRLLPAWMLTMRRPGVIATQEETDAKAKDERRVPSGVDLEGVSRVVSQLDLGRPDERSGKDRAGDG